MKRELFITHFQALWWATFWTSIHCWTCVFCKTCDY